MDVKRNEAKFCKLQIHQDVNLGISRNLVVPEGRLEGKKKRSLAFSVP